MTVKELIKQLESCNPNAQIMFRNEFVSDEICGLSFYKNEEYCPTLKEEANLILLEGTL